jgi:hypothetical protein
MRFVDLEGESFGAELRLYLQAVAPTLPSEERPLAVPLSNGVLFISTLLPALGFADDELRLLLAAFTLHDAQNRSPDDFDTHWERHQLGELVDPTQRELVRTLVLTKSDDRRRTEDSIPRLLAALTAATVHGLSPSFDEVQHKQQLRELLQQATGLSLVLSSHRICEDLGSFSALAHTAASSVMARPGATEVWVYPEGSWYIGTSKPQVSAEELQAAWLSAPALTGASARSLRDRSPGPSSGRTSPSTGARGIAAAARYPPLGRTCAAGASSAPTARPAG